MVCMWCPCHRKATAWKIYESSTGRSTVSNKEPIWRIFWEPECNFRNPRCFKINLNSFIYIWEEHKLMFSVDWENKLQCLLMSIEKVADPKQREPLLYTNGQFMPGLTWQLRAHLHSRHLRPAALTHMVSSEMTRGNPMEQPFPLPTMASEP